MRLLLLFLFCSSVALPADVGPAACENLKSLKLPAVTIASAEIAPAADSLPRYCKATGYVTTPGLHGEPSNKVNFEIDMPAANWNGKLYFAGGGGFSAGNINRMALVRGYASAYTDAGHTVISAVDGSWASNSETKKVDFFYRGIHVATVATKAIAKAYYSEPLQKAYFVGCSTGGRQAVMEAQRYPEDYDGIVAGAPAVDFTGLMIEFSWDERAELASPQSYIPPSKLPLIGKAVRAVCDAKDGLEDGLVGDPLHCHFDPSTLLCPNGKTNDCLTAPQVDTLKKLYAGPTTSSGKRIFPGMPTGHEDSPNYPRYIFGNSDAVTLPNGRLGFAGDYIKDMSLAPLQLSFQEEFLKYVGFRKGDPNYDWRSFNFDTDPARLAPLGKLDDALDPDLSKFHRRGGKLILYNGWADPVVPPERIIQYYQSVESLMGAEKTRDFARLFLAPGMNHCGGGPGPNSFDSVGALDAWVEQGTAPDQIIASHRGRDVADRTRPLCPYPQVAKYKGSGSIDDSASFTCAAP